MQQEALFPSFAKSCKKSICKDILSGDFSIFHKQMHLVEMGRTFWSAMHLTRPIQQKDIRQYMNKHKQTRRATNIRSEGNVHKHKKCYMPK